MEVTKSNFNEVLPQIKEATERADFISIDCELTGLNTGTDINAFDTQRQYYEKVRKSSKDFLVIQYGLCFFRYDKDLKVFKQQGYNFYIFPRPVNRLVPDHRFLCQASSIDFLITQGFDFNKLFKEGIPYLNIIEEDKYRETLADRQKTRANQLQHSFSPQNDKSTNIFMSVEEKSFVDDVLKQIEEFIVSDKEELNLPRCNAYVRRLIYQVASQKKIDKEVSLETRLLPNKDRILVVTRPKSKEDREDEERKKVEDEEQEFQNCIGFSEVVKTLVSSGKLVIGHNMCLDLLHTIDKFLTPLPQNYDEFKDLASCTFSNLLDTKYTSSAPPFKDLIKSNVLSHLLETITAKPFIIPNVEVEQGRQGYKLDSSKEHEAGYDAYITGLCFLSMWNYLGSLEDSEEFDPFTNFSLLDPYKNRLFLMRLQDAPYIRIGGNDPVPSRDHVLYMTFPKEWKLNDVMQLFSPFGNVYVAWIDDRSAYVGLQRRDQTALALSTLSQSDTYTVTPYAKRQAQLAGHNLLTSPLVLPRRKRSVDGLSTITKKRRTNSFGESSASKKRYINPIAEDPGELLQSNFENDQMGSKQETSSQIPELPKKANSKKVIQKTFEESCDWD